MLAIFGFSAAGLVAFLLILGLVLPGLPLDTLFRGGTSGDIFATSASEAQNRSEVTDVQEAAAPESAAPPLPPNPILGGVDIFYNCPDGCDDLVAQLTAIVEELDTPTAPVSLAPKTDMDSKILLVGAQNSGTFDAFDETAIRAFIEDNANR